MHTAYSQQRSRDSAPCHIALFSLVSVVVVVVALVKGNQCDGGFWGRREGEVPRPRIGISLVPACVRACVGGKANLESSISVRITPSDLHCDTLGFGRCM